MPMSRKKAIRAKCLDCCCGNAAEVRRCPAVNCPLHDFRMGTVKKGTYSEEEESDEITRDEDECE